MTDAAAAARRLLLVHAHPDDETINNGASMAKYVDEGAHVTLVTCTLGEEGEILLRGAHVMKGYWKRPDLTAAALRDGWLHTGDLGFVDESGRLCVTGRIKEVIRSGGKSVVPGEVEQALCTHPDVAEAAVLGVPDREWGERVVAVVVMAQGRALDEAALAAHCAQALSSHKRPRVFRAIDALPRSHYGKVQKGRLRELFAQPGAE